MTADSKNQLRGLLLGVVLTAAAFLWYERITKAEVYFDPLNDPAVLQCTHVMHLEMPVTTDRKDFIAKAFHFCEPKSGYHHYPCRCGLVKP